MSSVLDALRKAEGGAAADESAQAPASRLDGEVTPTEQVRASGGPELPGGGSFDGPPDGEGPSEPGDPEKKNPGPLAVVAVALVGLGIGYLVSSMLMGGSGDPDTIELAERTERSAAEAEPEASPSEPSPQNSPAASAQPPSSEAAAPEGDAPAASGAGRGAAPVLAEGKRARRERQPGREDGRPQKQPAADEKSAGTSEQQPGAGSASASVPEPAAAAPKNSGTPQIPANPKNPAAPEVADSKRPAPISGQAGKAESAVPGKNGGRDNPYKLDNPDTKPDSGPTARAGAATAKMPPAWGAKLPARPAPAAPAAPDAPDAPDAPARIWPGYKSGSAAQKPPATGLPGSRPGSLPDPPSSPPEAAAPAKPAAPVPTPPAKPTAPTPPAEPEISPVAPTGAPEIALLFIKWSSDPVYRVASMRGPGGKLLIVKEGDIVEGMKVSSIERGAVIMQWRGNLFRLAAGRSAS